MRSASVPTGLCGEGLTTRIEFGTLAGSAATPPALSASGVPAAASAFAAALAAPSARPLAGESWRAGGGLESGCSPFGVAASCGFAAAGGSLTRLTR